MAKPDCDICYTAHPRCNGHKDHAQEAGEYDPRPCRRNPRKGADVCPSHGGNAPAVRKNAIVRSNLEAWGIEDAPARDPGALLLRMIAQSAYRAERYAEAIAAAVAEAESLKAALVGDQLVMDPSTGKLHKTSDYIRGLTRLEAEERDRVVRYSKVAIDARLSERAVRVAEREGAMIAQVLDFVFDKIGITDDQRSMLPTVLGEAVMIVDSAA